MPVTGLYFCPDSGTTQAPAAAIADRLSKRYQPAHTGKWSLEHRLLRELAHGGQTGGGNVKLPSTSAESNNNNTTTASTSTTANTTTTNSSSNSTAVTPNTQSQQQQQQQLLQQQQQPRFMQYLDLSHHPGKKFCLIDKKSIVTIDSEFETILTTKLQGIWAMRQTLKAEGSMFELDDFRIRIATLSQGSVMKGVLVEVEYLPCMYMDEGEPIIRDFIQRLGLPGNPSVRLFLSSASTAVVTAKSGEHGNHSNDNSNRDNNNTDKSNNNDNSNQGRRKFTILDTGMQYMELLRLR